MLCHFLTVCFVLFVPFTNNYFLILFHAIIVPFIMGHWLLNNNICALTELEAYVRKKLNNNVEVDDNDCFTCRLIHPIYDFKKNNNEYSIFIYSITTFLWLISLYKLYNLYQNNKSFFTYNNISMLKINDLLHL